MKTFKYICLLTIYILSSLTVNAESYGKDNWQAEYRYRVKSGESVTVRTKPGYKKGKRLYKLQSGDVIYVDTNDSIKVGENYFIKVSGENAYASTYSLEREINPHYQFFQVPVIEVPKLASLDASPTAIWILLILMLVGFLYYAFSGILVDHFRNFFGTRDPLTGLKRTFFFNHQPYTSILKFCVALLVIAAAALVAELLIGGVVFVLLWIVKILCYVVVWVGIIGCVIGIACCFTGSGCIVGIPLALIGGAIWHYDDSIEKFAEAAAQTGLDTLNALNLLGFATDIVLTYWLHAILIAMSPLMLFLALAALSMIFAGILIIYEKIMTNRYNINHPCPNCQLPSEPATYYSDGEKLGVKLRPGVYGLFHITHPVTGEKMATLIANGRDEHTRRCPHCDKPINAKEGSEAHVAMVGFAESGKTTLAYRLMAELFNRGKNSVFFTDNKGNKDIETAIEDIKKAGKVVDFPQKTAEGRMRSIQVIIQPSGRSVPYRLFINDVSGESFDPEKGDIKNMPFFRNATSIMFLIDPFTTYFEKNDVSHEFTKWADKNNLVLGETDGKLNSIEAQERMKTALEYYNNKLKNVHFNFVLVKKDTGYLDGIDTRNPEELKSFIINDLGLENVVANAEDYASVNYFAVSTIEELTESNIGGLLDAVLNDVKIKM